MKKSTLSTLIAAGAIVGFGASANAQYQLVTGAGNPFQGITNPGIPAIADFNNDGLPDAYMHYGIGGTGNVRYFANTGAPGAPAFTLTPGAPLTSVNFSNQPAAAMTAADLNGDGRYDVFANSYYGGGILRFANTGTVSSPAFGAGTVMVPNNLSNFSPNDITLVDINGDGNLDLFVAGYATLRYFPATGQTAWAQTPAALPAGLPSASLAFGQGYTISFVDLDGDGTFDAFVGRTNSNGLDYYENTGTATTPNFVLRTGAQNPLNGINPGPRSKVQWLDITNNGRLDAVVNWDGGMAWIQDTTPVETGAGEAWQSYE